jgi:hypothetical protein
MSGQHHVEHHQVGPEVGHGGERLGAGARGRDLEALEAQRHGDDVDDVRLVVDDEDAGLRWGHGISVGRASVGFL